MALNGLPVLFPGMQSFQVLGRLADVFFKETSERHFFFQIKYTSKATFKKIMNKTISSLLVVEPTHLKNRIVKLDYFPKDTG